MTAHNPVSTSVLDSTGAENHCPEGDRTGRPLCGPLCCRVTGQHFLPACVIHGRSPTARQGVYLLVLEKQGVGESLNV